MATMSAVPDHVVAGRLQEEDSDSDGELVFEDAQETLTSDQTQNTAAVNSNESAEKIVDNVIEDYLSKPEVSPNTNSNTVTSASQSSPLDGLANKLEMLDTSDSRETTRTGRESPETTDMVEQTDENTSGPAESEGESESEEESGEEFTEDMIEEMLKEEGDNEDKEKDNVDGLEKEKESESDEEEEEAAHMRIDEDVLKERDAALSEEEREVLKEKAQTLKADGNAAFKESRFTDAVIAYTEALQTCPLCYAKERSIMYSNRAAAKLHMEKHKTAIDDCTKAVELNPNYLKALLRRAELYEKTEKLDEALIDYQKVLEMDPGQHSAREACLRLPDQIKERNEKMKDEMLGKLKELGNMVLKPFGLSTENFKMQQDPNSGGYSVSFQQGQKQ